MKDQLPMYQHKSKQNLELRGRQCFFFHSLKTKQETQQNKNKTNEKHNQKQNQHKTEWQKHTP